MKMYGRVEVQLDPLLSSALVGGEWSVSRPDRFTPGEKAAGTLLLRDWMGLRTGLFQICVEE